MTVGVGVICDDSSAIVIAADRLVTQEGTRTEFDSIPKASLLSNRAAISITGGYSEATEVIRSLTEEDRNLTSVRATAESILRERSRVRRRCMNAITQRYLGLDFEAFTAMDGPSLQGPQLINVHRLISDGFGLTFMLAGLDADGTAHLFTVDDTFGTPTNYDATGFTAIGCGLAHANAALIRSGYDKSWSLVEGVFAAYSAKRASEIVTGVGKATDVAVVTATTATVLSGRSLKRLRALHRKKTKQLRLSKRERSELSEHMHGSN